MVDKKAPMGHNLELHTVAEMASYVRQAAKLLSEAEQEFITLTIARDPLAGDLIEGTGGVRKLRFGKGGRGKSGGVRVIYYYYDTSLPCFLMDIFGKNEKSNLSKAERNYLAKLVTKIKNDWRRRMQ